MQTLKNSLISIAVEEHGAELTSIRYNGREYLWQADPAFWKRHSPVLFPIVGSLWNGEYRIDNKVYRMGQHGFARDMDFELVSRSDNELRYRLASTHDTQTRYPFDFILEIGYKIDANRVTVMWDVVNTGKEPLPFQIGAHPAFFWPMLTAQDIDGGLESMVPKLDSTDLRGYFRLKTSRSSIRPKSGDCGSQTIDLRRSVIGAGGCVASSEIVTIDADGYLPLTLETFAHDALVFEDSQISKVTLCDQERRPWVSLEFTSPLVGLWSPPGKRAPFVCIEPWYGRCDSVGYNGDFRQKPWMQLLDPQQRFHACYDIIIEESIPAV